ncbi:hypothetical protein E2562_015755, partial [Oryza meyeriana var. granulata]
VTCTANLIKVSSGVSSVEKLQLICLKVFVSLALLDGQTVLFVCSGIAVPCKGDITRLLTSASLLKAFNDKRKDHDNLK